MTHRVVQWTTGNVGKKSIHAIAANPLLELVGCYAWSPSTATYNDLPLLLPRGVLTST